MSRINPVSKENANPKSLEILTAVNKALGIVPNMVSTMAQSPAVANAYVGFNNALSQGSLSAKIRERIALTVAEENSCGYCLAAHTFLGKKVVEKRGQVTDADVAALRQHGFSDGEITEIIANVVLNIFTNYLNIAAGTEIDFPLAPALTA